MSTSATNVSPPSTSFGASLSASVWDPSSPSSSATRALQVPELVQLIQEQLLSSSSSHHCAYKALPPLPSIAALVRSLQVSSTWYRSGRHLIWRSVMWKDTMTGTRQELDILNHANWIRSLTCCLSSPAMVSFPPSLSSMTNTSDSPRPPTAINYSQGWKGVVHCLIHGHGSDNDGANEGDAIIGHRHFKQATQCTDPFVALDEGDKDKQRHSTAALRELVLKGVITQATLDDLFESDQVHRTFHPGNRLTHLTICQSENTFSLPHQSRRLRIDIFKILSALSRLIYLELDLEGDLYTPVSTTEDGTLEHGYNSSDPESNAALKMYHGLQTLRIRRLSLTRSDLEWVLNQCPYLKELATLSVASQLWQRPHPAVAPPVTWPPSLNPSPPALLHPIPIPSQMATTVGISQAVLTYQYNQQANTMSDPPVLQSQEEEKSLIMTLASKCLYLESLQIGLHKGALGPLDIQEIATHLKRLRSLGLSASDCTKDALVMLLPSKQHWQSQHPSEHHQEDPPRHAGKAVVGGHLTLPRLHLHHTLTTLTITTTCSSEKTSQAIHDFLCSTSFLETFEALNTTLYVDQMQPSINAEDDSNDECSRSRRWACTQLRTLKVRFARLPWRVRRSSDPPSPRTPTHAQQSRLSSAHSSKETIPSSPPTSPILQPQQQPACSSRHSTPSVCTATTTSSCSPELNRDLYHFLTPCTRLERLLIKEGLVLQHGREYDSLGALSNLEYLVWTTCYPVPIQEVDMEWLQPKNAADCEIAKEPLMMPAPRLRKVIIRRSKLGDYKNEQAIVDWFQRHRPNIEFAFQLTHEWDDDAI